MTTAAMPRGRDRAQHQMPPRLAGRQVKRDQEDRQRRGRAADVGARAGRIEAERPRATRHEVVVAQQLGAARIQQAAQPERQRDRLQRSGSAGTAAAARRQRRREARLAARAAADSQQPRRPTATRPSARSCWAVDAAGRQRRRQRPRRPASRCRRPSRSAPRRCELPSAARDRRRTRSPWIGGPDSAVDLRSPTRRRATCSRSHLRRRVRRRRARHRAGPSRSANALR